MIIEVSFRHPSYDPVKSFVLVSVWSSVLNTCIIRPCYCPPNNFYFIGHHEPFCVIPYEINPNYVIHIPYVPKRYPLSLTWVEGYVVPVDP